MSHSVISMKHWFRNGLIGVFIGVSWHIIFVLSFLLYIYNKSSISRLVLSWNDPLLKITRWFCDFLTRPRLVSEHDWIAVFVVNINIMILAGFLIGVMVTILYGIAFRKTTIDDSRAQIGTPAKNVYLRSYINILSFIVIALSNYLKTHNLADNICVGLLKGYTDEKKT